MVRAEAVSTRPVLLLAALLSVVAGIVYLAIGLGFVDDSFKSPPAPVMTAAGLAYIVGGSLIPFVSRRLLLLGAAGNAVVLGLFLLSAIRGTATVDELSVTGKVAQVALGIVLAWHLRRG
jgi:hypothetical protein